jgi:hypothetical protein
LIAHGEAAGGAEHLVALGVDELLETARSQTGLDDFGDGPWREPFELLVRSLVDESNLHLLGRTIVRTEILQCLRSRLQLTELWKQRPDILGNAIERPVFIVGSPRSGTSILHELMACDTDTRVPLFWEMQFPYAAATGENRAEVADLVTQFWHDVQPEYETMHANSGYLPNECIFIMNHAFLSDHWSGNHCVASYERSLIASDHRPAYSLHKRFLKTLQQAGGPRRWLLKAPSHFSQLRALLAVYPDARIVRTHRDPLKTLPSTINLMGTLKWMRCNRVDMSKTIAAMPPGYAMLFQMERDWRADGTLPNDQFIDVHFDDIVKHPADTVRAVYERLDWSFNDALATAITDYVAKKPKGSRGVHRYSLADIGLDAAEERQRFADYTAHYGVREEND